MHEDIGSTGYISTDTTYTQAREISPHQDALNRLTAVIDRAEKAGVALSERVQSLLLPSEPPLGEKMLAEAEREGSDLTSRIRGDVERLESLCRRIEAVTTRIDL